MSTAGGSFIAIGRVCLLSVICMLAFPLVRASSCFKSPTFFFAYGTGMLPYSFFNGGNVITFCFCEYFSSPLSAPFLCCEKNPCWLACRQASRELFWKQKKPAGWLAATHGRFDCISPVVNPLVHSHCTQSQSITDTRYWTIPKLCYKSSKMS